MIPRRFKKIGRVIFYAFFFVNILFLIIFVYGAQQVGYLNAQYDLWKGRYAIKTYGLHYPQIFATEAKTLKGYGIDYVLVAGCVVNDFIIENVAAYNFVMKKAIKRDLGVNVDKLLDYEDEAEEINQSFDEELKEKPAEEPADEPNVPETILSTLKPGEEEDTLYDISHCFQTLRTNLDSDEMNKKICLRTLKYQEYDDTFPYTSLILDVFKEDKKILRQELDRTFYYEEQFVLLKDIDKDGKSELLTRVAFGPQCAGDKAYRIYQFQESRFELVMNMFGVNPNNPFIKNALNIIPNLEEMIVKTYMEKTKSENPCGFYNKCIKSEPWLTDSDHDGLPEILFLVEPPYKSDNNRDVMLRV